MLEKLWIFITVLWLILLFLFLMFPGIELICLFFITSIVCFILSAMLITQYNQSDFPKKNNK